MIDLAEIQGTRRVLSIDPGHATGWSFWEVSPSEPMTRRAYGLIKGGLAGVHDWINLDARNPKPDSYQRLGQGLGHAYLQWASTLLVEDFTNDDDAGRELVSAHIIGALRYEQMRTGGVPPTLRNRSLKAGVRDQILKDAGLWLTGSNVGWTDGRDVNDSAIHALGWAKENGHVPTVLQYWPDTD